MYTSLVNENPYEVKPSYSFWAPWIGEQVRVGDLVLNTEHRKCCRDKDEELGNSMDVTEDRLVELLHGNKVYRHYNINVYTEI